MNFDPNLLLNISGVELMRKHYPGSHIECNHDNFFKTSCIFNDADEEREKNREDGPEDYGNGGWCPNPWAASPEPEYYPGDGE